MIYKNLINQFALLNNIKLLKNNKTYIQFYYKNDYYSINFKSIKILLILYQYIN